MRCDGTALGRLHRDVRASGAHVESEITVDVGDVEQSLEEVGGDVAFLLELLDRGGGALDGALSAGAKSGLVVM